MSHCWTSLLWDLKMDWLFHAHGCCKPSERSVWSISIQGQCTCSPTEVDNWDNWNSSTLWSFATSNRIWPSSRTMNVRNPPPNIHALHKGNSVITTNFKRNFLQRPVWNQSSKTFTPAYSALVDSDCSDHSCDLYVRCVKRKINEFGFLHTV